MITSEEERKLLMNIKIEAYVYHKLRKLAQKLGMTYSELIKHLISLSEV